MMSDADADRIAHELLDSLAPTCTTAEAPPVYSRPAQPIMCTRPAEVIVHFDCPRGPHTHHQAICREHRDLLASGRQAVTCPHCAAHGRVAVPLRPVGEEPLRGHG